MEKIWSKKVCLEMSLKVCLLLNRLSAMLILLLCFVLEVLSTCSRGQFRYSCTTAEFGNETIQQFGVRFGVRPEKICDWNGIELAGCSPDTIVPTKFALKIPKGACTPKPGVWECYTVRDGDTVESIAFGNHSLHRSVEILENYNGGKPLLLYAIADASFYRCCIRRFVGQPHSVFRDASSSTSNAVFSEQMCKLHMP